MVLAAVGLYVLRSDRDGLRPLLRWGGHATLLLTVFTVVTGILAGGFTGGEEHLQHHRYLGTLTLLCAALAAISFETGIRRDITDLRKFGIGMWWITSFATVGTSHWGVLAEHTDVVPF